MKSTNDCKSLLLLQRFTDLLLRDRGSTVMEELTTQGQGMEDEAGREDWKYGKNGTCL